MAVVAILILCFCVFIIASIIVAGVLLIKNKDKKHKEKIVEQQKKHTKELSGLEQARAAAEQQGAELRAAQAMTTRQPVAEAKACRNETEQARNAARQNEHQCLGIRIKGNTPDMRAYIQVQSDMAEWLRKDLCKELIPDFLRHFTQTMNKILENEDTFLITQDIQTCQDIRLKLKQAISESKQEGREILSPYQFASFNELFTLIENFADVKLRMMCKNGKPNMREFFSIITNYLHSICHDVDINTPIENSSFTRFMANASHLQAVEAHASRRRTLVAN